MAKFQNILKGTAILFLALLVIGEGKIKRFTLGKEKEDRTCPYDEECVRNEDCICSTENLECKIIEGGLKRCVVTPAAAAQVRYGSPGKSELLAKFIGAFVCSQNGETLTSCFFKYF